MTILSLSSSGKPKPAACIVQVIRAASRVRLCSIEQKSVSPATSCLVRPVEVAHVPGELLHALCPAFVNEAHALWKRTWVLAVNPTPSKKAPVYIRTLLLYPASGTPPSASGSPPATRERRPGKPLRYVWEEPASRGSPWHPHELHPYASRLARPRLGSIPMRQDELPMFPPRKVAFQFFSPCHVHQSAMWGMPMNARFALGGGAANL